MVRNFLQYLKGWRGFALISYMWLILMGWVIVYVDVQSFEMKKRFYIVSVAEVILVALIYICPRLLGYAKSLKISNDDPIFTKREAMRFFLHTWVLAFVVFFVMYVIFYPGGFDEDAVSMYSQAVGLSKYNDWHPVINTLFSYKLPLSLTNNWNGAPVLFQVIIFSLLLAYMSLTLLEYGNYKYAKRFLIYIMLNPATLTIYLSSQKDSSFSIAMMLLMTFGVRVYFTKGAWLKSVKNTILFIVVLTAGTLFRHNAILFTLPILLAVSLYVKKRQALLILLCFLGLFYAIKYPLYEKMDVQKAEYRQVETLGFPMSIIGNAVKEAPERLDRDILDFAYSFASKDTWREKYDPIQGIWSVRKQPLKIKKLSEKYTVNLNTIEEAGWEKILGMALRCFREAPWHSLRGALGVTSVVYSIAGVPFGGIVPAVAPNDLGLSDNNFFRLDFLTEIFNKINALLGFKETVNERIFSGEFTLRTLIILWNYATMVFFKHIFWCIGMLNLVVIIFILARLDFSKVSDWKKLCLVLPMLVHNFGTMLLLQGTTFRIFYYSYLVVPLVLLVLLRDNSEAQS